MTAQAQSASDGLLCTSLKLVAPAVLSFVIWGCPNNLYRHMEHCFQPRLLSWDHSAEVDWHSMRQQHCVVVQTTWAQSSQGGKIACHELVVTLNVKHYFLHFHAPGCQSQLNNEQRMMNHAEVADLAHHPWDAFGVACLSRPIHHPLMESHGHLHKCSMRCMDIPLCHVQPVVSNHWPAIPATYCNFLGRMQPHFRLQALHEFLLSGSLVHHSGREKGQS